MRAIQPFAGGLGGLLGLALVLGSGALLGGCDNPGCVFTTQGCFGQGPSGALAAEAFPPADGLWIADGKPAIQEVFPSGSGASRTTPVGIVFSETMVSSTVLPAFRLEQVSDFGVVPVPATPVLVADGRMLLLVPTTELPALTDFRVIYTQSGNARDLTGLSLDSAAGSVLASFTTVSTNAAAPSLIASFPKAAASGQSATTEIVAVFDRAMAADNFAGAGWTVTAGGEAPAFDPSPAPLALGAGLLGPTDTRVWRWRSVDAQGTPQALGNGIQVQLALSPSGSKLVAQAGGELPATTVSFQTAPFAAPVAARILSLPEDAIGIANLTPGDPEELVLEVELEGALSGDRLTVFLFGKEKGEDGKLIALVRNVTLSGPGLESVPLELADLNLTTSTNPPVARFADGEVTFALRLGRGGLTSPIRLLDVDPGLGGVQSPVLDTVRPTLEDLLAPGGGGDLFWSDFPGLTLAGTASERLRRVAVTTPLGDNGPEPEVVGSGADGFFLARPVPLGLLDPADLPLDYEFVLFDRALNASAPISGLFTQRGASGPAPLGPEVRVEVYDGRNLAPIAGAQVYTHADLGDASAYPAIAVAATGSSGVAELAAHQAPAVATIVTVDAAGYDRFTFHGVVGDRLAVPLLPTVPSNGNAAGTVTAGSTLAALTLPGSDLAVADTRRAFSALPFFLAKPCTGNPLVGQPTVCPFGPEPVRARRAGARSLMAGEFELAEPNFSAATLLKAFDLDAARSPLAPGQFGQDLITVPRLLNEPGVPPEELPVSLGPFPLSAAFASGIDLGELVGDPAVTGAPLIGVELLLPGHLAPVPVGLGIGYANGPAWTVRAAYAGAAQVLAEELGAPDQLLHLRAELRDAAGARSFARFSLAQLAQFGNALFAPPVPVPLAPAPDSLLAATSFDVELPNTLVDGLFAPAPNGAGLYRVRLVDAAGRGWDLWRPDLPDAIPVVRVHVPDLTLLGGTPPAAGQATLWASSLAHPGFDPGSFLWSELERRATFYGQSAPRELILP